MAILAYDGACFARRLVDAKYSTKSLLDIKWY